MEPEPPFLLSFSFFFLFFFKFLLGSGTQGTIPATETKMLLLLIHCISKQWARVSFLTRVKFLSRQAGWNFSI